MSYCAAEVRRHDRDRFLTALFAPADRREELFALYAFANEVAKTRETVSEPMIGRIRLQWWREALDGIRDGEPRKHEVVEALDRARSSGLDTESLRPLIDAREFDLEDEAPKDMDALVGYARSTAGALNRIAATYLGATEEKTLIAAEEAGVAHALTGLVRALPFHARDRRRFLPDDVIEETGLALDDLFELRPKEELRQAVRQVCEHAARHLETARSDYGNDHRLALPALLLGTIAGHNIRRIAKADHSPGDRSLLSVSAMLPVILWVRNFTGRY